MRSRCIIRTGLRRQIGSSFGCGRRHTTRPAARLGARDCRYSLNRVPVRARGYRHVKKSIELTDLSTIVQTTKNIRWLQIAAPFVVSLLVGAMLGAMLGGLLYGANADPTSGDFKFVLSQGLGILLGLVAGYLWSRQV